MSKVTLCLSASVERISDSICSLPFPCAETKDVVQKFVFSFSGFLVCSVISV